MKTKQIRKPLNKIQAAIIDEAALKHSIARRELQAFTAMAMAGAGLTGGQFVALDGDDMIIEVADDTDDVSAQ